MRFEVRALSADNVIASHTLEAQDEADALRQARVQSLTVVQVRRAAGLRAPTIARTSRFSLVLFSQELLALLTAGLGLLESMEALGEKDASAARRNVVTRLAQSLREGHRLSRALAEQPATFPPLFVGLVEAAEGTSDLPRALARYIEYRTRIDGVRSKVVSAAIYPSILLVVGSLVTAFLLGFVVPRFATVYQDTGRELPGMSRLLLQAGQFIAAHTSSVATLATATLVGLGALLLHAYRQGGWARLLGRLPGVGHYLHLYELSRLYLTLGMLSEGGIPLVKALATSARVVSPAMRARLDAAGAQIQAGRPLSEAFADHQLTTSISLRMLRAGEHAGELSTMLTRAAVFYDGDISRFVDRFTRSFEPILMAVIGAIVGLIVVLLYMPIFDLAGSLQ